MEFIWWNSAFKAYLVIILEKYPWKVFTIQSIKIPPLKINPLIYSSTLAIYSYISHAIYSYISHAIYSYISHADACIDILHV